MIFRRSLRAHWRSESRIYRPVEAPASIGAEDALRCRYCGSETSSAAARCPRCMRRLSSQSDYAPVIETAAAPALDLRESQSASSPRRGPQLAAVNPAPARTVAPTQPALFPFREGQKIVELSHLPHPARSRQSEGSRPPRKRPVPEGQSAFDFDAPPAPNVLAHASDKSTQIAVAPVALRAMSAMFDTGLAGGMTGLFLTVVRLMLGYLPASNAAYVSYACGAVLFFFLYKLIFCLYGRPTFGLQGARLRVVSFTGSAPRRSQCLIRLFAGCLSVISAGMGLLWSLADQDKLSWHDHISQTFLTCEPED